MLSYKHQLLQSQLPKNTYCPLVIADSAEDYVPENYNNNISCVINDYFYDKRNENFKYIASQITFKGITYKTNMYICVGKDCYDYFIICKIKYFLINNSYTDVYFLGTTIKIVYNSDLGVYEQFEVKDSQEHKIDKISLFPYSVLLAPHPILETQLNSIAVYIFKYAPLDL